MTHIKICCSFLMIFFLKLYAQQPIKQIRPPWGYVFTSWEGPQLDIITYIPANANTDTPILIVIPGASRDAQRFHASWLDLAKKKNFAVLTIGAHKDLFPDEYSYNAGGVINEKGDILDNEKWLFSAIEPIFIDFKNRYGFNSKKFYLFGHSAGGGVVHRYLLFKPTAPVLNAVAANPAFVTLPDENIDYPFGIGRVPIKKAHMRSWFKSNLAIILGGNDLGPRTKPLSNGPMALEQGPNCLTRGKLLYKSARKRAKDLNIRFQWELIIVPGVGHDNFNIAPAACEYLFGK